MRCAVGACESATPRGALQQHGPKATKRASAVQLGGGCARAHNGTYHGMMRHVHVCACHAIAMQQVRLRLQPLMPVRLPTHIHAHLPLPAPLPGLCARS